MAAQLTETSDLDPPSPRIARADSHQFAGKYPRLSPVLSSSIAQVHVGDSASVQTFNIDRDFLASCSLGFEQSLETRHNGSTHLELPHEDPLIFEVFSMFIAGEHQGSLVCTDGASADIDCRVCGREAVSDWDVTFLVYLYSFAVRQALESFRTAIVKEILHYYRRAPMLPSVQVLEAVACAVRDRDDDIHLLLIALYIYTLNEELFDLRDAIGRLPANFYNDILDWEYYICNNSSDDDSENEPGNRMTEWFGLVCREMDNEPEDQSCPHGS